MDVLSMGMSHDYEIAIEEGLPLLELEHQSLEKETTIKIITQI